MEETKKISGVITPEKKVPRAVVDGILTIEVDSKVESMEEQEDARWHQLLNAHRTRKILTGELGGVEKLESGWVVAVTYFNGFRIIIPMNEMMINLSGDGRENADTLNRQTRIANNMLGCEIDFIIKDLDTKTKSVVASRKDAMLKKRQMFYFPEEEGAQQMIYPGRLAQARVIAVAPKAVRLEVFGVEVSVRARDMAWEWMIDASEKFQIGDLVLVTVHEIHGDSPEDLAVSVDAKSATANVNKDNLKKCHKQGKYVGTITDVYKGTYFIRLDIGVNAVAHSCNMPALPAKKDKIGFVVTRINDNYEVAEGIITRLIKRGM
ncbi:RNA-binding protein [Parablautia sp. Marseille-Q6255]|uniref:RNA-binding protein n=1 Tax=Parablautia sp. Marseille-Q6255 TaxID=3039593 RepID=UPI0024BCB642|nr:RNA-binding protein [Parablautia sp. Marseille-Q6255]